MIWVIFDHCCWFFSSEHWKYFFCIEMPLFFFVTGASSGMSKNRNFLKFYLTRFQRILIPYWIYSLVVVAFLSAIAVGANINSIQYNSPGHFFDTNFNIFFINFFDIFPNWIIPRFSHQKSFLPFLMWHLWYIPVFLLVILIFPSLMLCKERRYIPLFVLILLILLFQFFQDFSHQTFGGEIAYYIRNVVFYGFWAYLGLFFKEIFCQRYIVKAFILVLICTAVILGAIFFDPPFNMRDNNHQCNIIFLFYSLGFLSVMYIFSDIIVKMITFLRKASIFNSIYKQYMEHSLTIYLFHPFLFLILLGRFKNYCHGIGINSEPVLFIIIFLSAVPLSALMGKLFSGVEKIRIIK